MYSQSSFYRDYAYIYALIHTLLYQTASIIGVMQETCGSSLCVEGQDGSSGSVRGVILGARRILDGRKLLFPLDL